MFKPGDIVRSKKTGSFYTVKMIVSDFWFTHNESTTPKLMSNFEKVSTTWGDYSPCIQGQKHKWVDVGFRFTHEVCFYCNKEKNASEVSYGN